MRRSVTIRRSAEAGAIEIRAGDRVLGQISGLAGQSDTLMTGTFSHRPAYADFAAEYLRLARALEAGRQDEAIAIQAAMEAAGVQVWHTTHEMRIDRPHSLVVSEGTVRFAPNDAFQMMRTGGL